MLIHITLLNMNNKTKHSCEVHIRSLMWTLISIMYIYSCNYMYKSTNTCTNACTNACTNTCTNACTNTCTNTCTNACTNARTNT